MGNEVAELTKRNTILEQENQRLSEHAESLEKANAELEARADKLQTALDALTRKFFGVSSEKASAEQRTDLGLFDEAEQLELEARQEAPAEQEETTEEPKQKKSTTRTLRYVDSSVPQETVVLDIDEQDKQCGCGSKLTKIGEEEHKKLDIEPPKIRVIRYVRSRYACRTCEGSGDEEKPAVRVAPPVPSVIPGGFATENTLAFVIASKFADAIPLYRQEQQFSRIGARISRETLADWVLASAEALQPVYEALARYVRSGPVLLADETPVQVLKESGRKNTTKSFMWAAYGGEPQRPAVRFHYARTRASEHAQELVGDYTGLLQTDGYSGYAKLCRERDDLTHVACFAHTRRKFVDASTANKKAGAAEQAIAYIGKLYAIEKNLASWERDEKFRAERERLAIPVLEAFHDWLEKKRRTIPETTLVGKAVGYALGQWEQLVRYLESPHLSPDTNAVENTIRPFAVGRRNWLFSGSPRGARASATLYSLVTTAKLNNIEPYRYLRTVLYEIPRLSRDTDYKDLLPQFITLKP